MCSAFDPTNKNSYTRSVLRALDPTRKKASGTGGFGHRVGVADDDNLRRQVMAESQPPPTPFDAISADARMMKRRYARSLGFSPYFLRQ